MSEAQQPSVGRVVHYVSYGTPGGEYTQQCRAATITEVGDDTVGLAVLNPTGLFFNRQVPYDEGDWWTASPPEGRPAADRYEGGTWHWPERV